LSLEKSGQRRGDYSAKGGGLEAGVLRGLWRRSKATGRIKGATACEERDVSPDSPLSRNLAATRVPRLRAK